MELFVDNNLVEFPTDGTVEEALQYVQEKICKGDQMVISVQCDGKDVPVATMGEVFAKPVTNYDRLDITTGTRAQLVIDAMEQALECLYNTEDACRESADLLTQGKSTEGASTFAECLRVWQQIHEAVSKSLALLNIDVDSMTINEKPLVEVIGKPKDVLFQVRDALQAQDHVMLADLLKYEFPEVTENWQQLINKLHQTASEQQATLG